MKTITASILALSLVACVPSMSAPGPTAPGGPSLATERVGQDPGIIPLAFVGVLAVAGGAILLMHVTKDRSHGGGMD